MFFSLYPNNKKEEKKASWWIKSVWPLYSVAIAISILYLFFGNPIFHEACFAAIIVACVLNYSYYANTNIKGLEDEKAIRQQSFRMTITAVLLMISAFGIWNIDNVACKYLRSMRSNLVWPFAILSPLLQFHALWHILTVVAADYTVAGIMYVWCQGHRDRIKSKLVYKFWGCFPLLKMTPARRSSPRINNKK